MKWQKTRLDTARHSRVFSTAFFVPKLQVDRKALNHLSYGLFILSSRDHFDNACIINTAVQIASDPVRIMISVQNNNLTRNIIEKTKEFNISVLTQSVPFDVIRHFGMQSGRDVDKFQNITDIKRSKNGIIYIDKHTNAYFSVQVNHKHNLGSHTMFIGEVCESAVLSQESSCTYSHYHKEIKPK